MKQYHVTLLYHLFYSPLVFLLLLLVCLLPSVLGHFLEAYARLLGRLMLLTLEDCDGLRHTEHPSESVTTLKVNYVQTDMCCILERFRFYYVTRIHSPSLTIWH
jgi:hypothetical protein